MLHSTFGPARGGSPAHVIVCGNEKGGSGKSTLAMHLAVALLRSGHSVGTVDLDGRQLSLTRYVENRRRWARDNRAQLPVPAHFHVSPAQRERVADAQGIETHQLTDALSALGGCDFIVVDTPGADTYLNRLAHRIADTLVTPMNDSFIDFDVLARIDPATVRVVEPSQYADAVREARRQRRLADNRLLDWIVVRNRMSSITSRNEHKVDACLRQLSMQLGFRLADGVTERVAYRELFALGLTAVDPFELHSPDGRPSRSQLAARAEIESLVTALRLPTDDIGRRRADARRRFAEIVNRPIDLPDIFVR
ncbi:MAG: AAA family ATPase [Rhizobiaceae bacterium]|nr:AAA family ATPase [Rhizobiaceae bacterium]